jgi:hypothetical protein
MNNQDKTPEGITPNLPLWSYQLQQDSHLAVRTRKDLEIHLITRALKDESFRAELIANPKAVIEQEIGSKLPDELEITVLEETADTIYMVLPCNPYEGLSEEELQATLGMTYEDVALWVLEQQRNTLLDEKSSVKIITQAWKDEEFKLSLFNQPRLVIEQELGEAVDEKINLQVILETPITLYILLPELKDDLSPFLTVSTPFPSIADSALLMIGSGGGGCNPCNNSSIGGNSSKTWTCSNSSQTQTCNS